MDKKQTKNTFTSHTNTIIGEQHIKQNIKINTDQHFVNWKTPVADKPPYTMEISHN